MANWLADLHHGWHNGSRVPLALMALTLVLLAALVVASLMVAFGGDAAGCAVS